MASDQQREGSSDESTAKVIFHRLLRSAIQLSGNNTTQRPPEFNVVQGDTRASSSLTLSKPDFKIWNNKELTSRLESLNFTRYVLYGEWSMATGSMLIINMVLSRLYRIANQNEYAQIPTAQTTTKQSRKRIKFPPEISADCCTKRESWYQTGDQSDWKAT